MDYHGKHFHNQRMNTFLLSLDGMLRKEAPVVIYNLILLMAEKIKEPFSHVGCCVHEHIAITAAILQSHTIRGAHLPSPLWYWEPDMDSGSGLGLAQKNAWQNNFTRSLAQFFCHQCTPVLPPCPFITCTMSLVTDWWHPAGALPRILLAQWKTKRKMEA